MRKAQVKPPIVIAVDSLTPPRESLSHALAAALLFTRQLNAIPLVRTVAGPAHFGWPTKITEPMKLLLRRMSERRLRECVEDFKGQRINTEVILQTSSSRKTEAATLAKEAKKLRARAIVVFSHVEKGPVGTSLNGFILSLIHLATAPVLVINAQTVRPLSIKRIVFATDFASGSETSFRAMVQMARELSAEILLLHVMPTLPEENLAAASGIAGGRLAVEEFLEMQEVDIRKTAAKWIKDAQKQEVVVHFKLVTGTFAVADAILEETRRADLTAVTEKTGPVASFILGSVTRTVLRKAEKPVLVFTPPKKRQR